LPDTRQNIIARVYKQFFLHTHFMPKASILQAFAAAIFGGVIPYSSIRAQERAFVGFSGSPFRQRSEQSGHGGTGRWFGPVANDPTPTLAVPCGNALDAGFNPYQSTRMSR
jgi:hypothetical protein